MPFRVAFLNLEQDHRRWEQRRGLVADQLGDLAPDIFAMNEICLPKQTGRWLQREAIARLGRRYALVQQSKTNSGSRVEGEGLLTRFPVLETGNLDYQTRDYVALVARMEIENRILDVYVTHLFMSRGDESLREFQVQQLLEWIASRDDADAQIVCGDFNAPPDAAAARRMAGQFTATQSAPTAFTPLADAAGAVTHPYWDRFDRSIDYIWVRGPIDVGESGVCFNIPDVKDESLWPSDHAGVWADLSWA
ncbi:MAG: endonuclease/exonuclease/phosphatase family protein [Alphaproteobacteria bacterium]|nr:endonuclease/exonuclease/phosphatase family protein [Alphaproteobacteria bacterium]